jgi:hypothetical protein
VAGQYWSKKFKVTPAKLKSAVKKVGHSARKVEAYIKFQRHISRDKTLIALSQTYEVRYLSLMRAFLVVNCQSALVWLATSIS